MAAVNTINMGALKRLNLFRKYLTPQQYKTLRGQVLAGDFDGAMRGLDKIIRRATDARKTRQGAGHRPG